MKVILLHGKDTDPNGKWYQWFVGACKEKGIEALVPALPNAGDPVIAEWLREIDALEPDNKTILIGHSRGGMAVLRWLERQSADVQVKKVILIGANSGDVADRHIPAETNHGFYTESGYDFEKIKSHCNDFVVMHSTDDHVVPFSNGEKNAAGLEAKFLVFNDRRHFGTGIDEVPELVEEII